MLSFRDQVYHPENVIMIPLAGIAAAIGSCCFPVNSREPVIVVLQGHPHVIQVIRTTDITPERL